MATHDYVLANASGAAFRADLNNALAAIVSNNSNATEPATTYAYMWWMDTTTGQLKQRNAANDGWITIREIDGTMLMEDGTVSGRLLVGTSSDFGGGKLQVANGSINVGTFIGASSGAYEVVFEKSRSSTVGTDTLVANGDTLGQITFKGGDGSQQVTAAFIRVGVDGTPGTNDMPGRLVFSVTPDGGSSPTTSPSAMTINSGQEVLIGYSTDNGAYKLQVNSQIFATSATIATSDGRYKENVATLDGCVDLVKALRPVSFDWKAQQPITRIDEDGETVVVREAHNFPDGKQVGFIAQEVEKVLADKPWLGSVIKQNVRPAVTDSDGNELAPEEEFLGIAEGNLVAVLTSAVKDAIGRIESLEAEVAALKA